MRNFLNVLTLALLMTALSCSFMHDDHIVARVGSEELPLEQVTRLIPHGLSQEDSLRMAEKIIDDWALAIILQKRLTESLSEDDKDLTREIEEYRNSLLRFRFEQRYMASRLDTLVTEEQMNEYYNEKGDLYALKFPIMKVRIFRLPQKSRERDDICKMLSSGSDDAIEELKFMAMRPECSYRDYDGKWVSVVELAKDYGMDYGTLLSKKDSKSFMTFTDEHGEEILIYVAQMVGFGKIPPLEYCRDNIKEAIVGRRKYELSQNMEQDLLSEATQNGEFEKYEIENK